MISQTLRKASKLLPIGLKSFLVEKIKQRNRTALSKLKQNTVKSYQSKYKYKIFIETGTFKGDMVEAQRGNFEKLYSIELGADLWAESSKRFLQYSNIKILHGDSGQVLNDITKDLNQPAIFWLDGHYSSGITALGETECPIFGEIDAIFSYRKLNHVILVDDARCFNGIGDWPTINAVTDYVHRYDPEYNCVVEKDIIRYIK